MISPPLFYQSKIDNINIDFKTSFLRKLLQLISSKEIQKCMKINHSTGKEILKKKLKNMEIALKRI